MTEPSPQAVRVVPVSNEQVAALSRALREGAGITTTAGVLTEAVRLVLAASPASAEVGGSFTVDDLAQEIRRVDGNHDLGAGALAEALMPFLSRAAPPAGGGLDPTLFDHAWALVQAIRGGGPLPHLTPDQAADAAAPYLLALLDERNALTATEAKPEGEGSDA